MTSIRKFFDKFELPILIFLFLILLGANFLTALGANIFTDYRFDKYGHSGLSITSSFVLRTLLVFSFIMVIRKILKKLNKKD